MSHAGQTPLIENVSSGRVICAPSLRIVRLRLVLCSSPLFSMAVGFEAIPSIRRHAGGSVLSYSERQVAPGDHATVLAGWQPFPCDDLPGLTPLIAGGAGLRITPRGLSAAAGRHPGCWPYSSSVTYSPQVALLPSSSTSTIARWVIKRSGAAPCQCS